MAYGELFRHFTIRFSLKKAQHVRLLQKFEDKKLNGGKAKNQVVMDALELYYDALEAREGKELPKELTPAYFEKRLSEMKEEIKAEVIQEIVRIVLGNAVAGMPAVAAGILDGELNLEEIGENDVADISEMPDIMDKIMNWSES